MKALCIIISVVITYTPLGQQKESYVASVERMTTKDCETVKKSVDSSHNTVLCVKESGK